MDAMEGWSDFYTLIGATAGTLIGLIFVVVSLGADHAKAGDEHRTTVGVTPTLVHFAALLVSALAMLAPLSNIARAVTLGIIGCAGLAYLFNLALLASKRIKAEERDTLWFGVLPMVAYAGFAGYRRGVGVCRELRAGDRWSCQCVAARRSAA